MKTMTAMEVATGTEVKVAPAMKHTAEALIVVRNSVRKKKKNFAASI